MRYPVILSGDHAAFEIEHIDALPQERPDWPLPSFDARDWAAAFGKVAVELGYSDMDGAWLTTWFANALMRGYDERDSQIQRDHGE